MIRELKKTELSMIWKLIRYCKNTKDKRVSKNNGKISVILPMKVIYEIFEEKKSINSIISHLQRIVSELKCFVDIRYDGQGVKIVRCYPPVGLLVFPEKMDIQIKRLIKKGDLKIISKRKGWR